MWVTFLFAKEKEYFRTRKKKKGGGTQRDSLGVGRKTSIVLLVSLFLALGRNGN